MWCWSLECSLKMKGRCAQGQFIVQISIRRYPELTFLFAWGWSDTLGAFNTLSSSWQLFFSFLFSYKVDSPSHELYLCPRCRWRRQMLKHFLRHAAVRSALFLSPSVLGQRLKGREFRNMISCEQVSRLRLLGDHVHSTRIAFVEFVMVRIPENCCFISLRDFHTSPSPFKFCDNNTAYCFSINIWILVLKYPLVFI